MQPSPNLALCKKEALLYLMVGSGMAQPQPDCESKEDLAWL